MPHCLLFNPGVLPDLLKEEDRSVKIRKIEAPEVIVAQNVETVSCIGISEPTISDSRAVVRQLAALRAIGLDLVDEKPHIRLSIEANVLCEFSHLLFVGADAELELARVELIFHARPVFVWDSLPWSGDIVGNLNMNMS